MKIPELLAPAGTYETLVAVCNAGADAVYAAGTKYGARAYAGNFSDDELLKAISYVHLHGKKFYLTLNTLIKDGEFNELYDYLLPLYCAGLDAVIVQDLGVVDYLRMQFPKLPVHISTQAAAMGEDSLHFFEKMGAERAVLARELSLEEIAYLKKNTKLELEIFVHGALCYCYSGMCFYSSLIGGRSGNRGRCAQPCRMNYSINSKERDWMSLKDLSAIDILDKLCEIGVDSLKIEGRMKSTEYAAGVTAVYRKYLDLLKNNISSYKVSKEDKDMLNKLYQRRGFTEGYFKQHNGPDMLINEEERKFEDINSTFNLSEKKIPVNFNAYFSPGTEAILVVEDKENNIVSVYGEMCQEAKSKSLDVETVKEKLSRLNDTALDAVSINVEINGQVFIPLSALNSLRRTAVEEYLSMLNSKFYRDVPERVFPVKGETKESAERYYSASFLSLNQGYALLNCHRIKRVYFPFDLFFGNYEDSIELIKQFKNKEVSVYISLPEIFRKKTRSVFLNNLNNIKEIFDGYLIKNIDELEFIKSNLNDVKCVLDFTLYSYNSNSINVWKAYSKQLTAPIELNFHELKKMNLSDSELVIYGRYPMMFTANCLKKNSDKCTAMSDTLYYKDRKGMSFFVKSVCSSCYNIIFNSKYTSLLGAMDKIMQLNVSGLRFSFTDERQKDVIEIVNGLKDPEDFTRGHFIRGVE